MSPNLAQLSIKRSCVHTVAKKAPGADTADLTLSDNVIHLPDTVEEIVKQRVAASCGEKGRAFEMDIAKFDESSFYGYATKMRQASDSEFIDHSKDIARLLARHQSVSAPEAALFIFDAVDKNGLPVVLCIKAEGTNALAKDTDDTGTTLRAVDDLFMGKTERFFKIGVMFKRPPSAETEESPLKTWGAILYDHQLRSGTNPAAYFYDNFLGLSVESNAKIQSKRVFNKISEFIEKRLAHDPEAKTLALGRLEDYLSNENIKEIDLSHIKDTIIPPEKRDDFNKDVRNVFTHNVMKDMSLIANSFNVKTITFPEKVVLKVPAASYERVEVIENQADLNSLRLGEGYTIIRIQGNPDRFLRYDKPTDQ